MQHHNGFTNLGECFLFFLEGAVVMADFCVSLLEAYYLESGWKKD
jgi:hypothetical protein